MTKQEVIKELELLADSCDSDYALEVNGYNRGVWDAIEIVKKLNTPDVSNNEVKLCCDCKEPLPEGFITRCPKCYDEMYFPR